MKTNTAERTCEVQTTGNVRGAQIADSAAMFDILYNRLYTKKELAIVRELITNAWDSHCRAGNTETPIDVHLPTSLEPWFAIRDYGVGLSAEAVETLYMDYGRSDKNDSNDEIGGFGLGSKSPYCYTDQFSVISCKDGQRHVYTAFLQSDGRPACTRWSSEVTDEPNGLEVLVNVDNRMAYDRFEEALQRLWPYLPTAPRINRSSFETPEHEILLDVKFDKVPLQRAVLRKETKRHETDVRFIQGIVPYSVSLHDLGIGLDHPAHKLIQRGSVCDIYVDVGALEVTASRESLSLSDTTKTEARRIIDAVVDRMETEIQTQMRQAKSWYDWVKPASFLVAERRVVPAAVEPYIDRIERRDGQSSPLLQVLVKNHAHQIMIYQRGRGGGRTRRFDRDKVRRDKINELSRDELDRAQLYIRPKTSWPIKEFIENQLVTNDDRIILFTGGFDEHRQWLDALGVPHELHEVPYIKPKQSERKRTNGESTRYETGRLDMTAAEIIENYSDYILLNVETPCQLQGTLSRLRTLGILEGPPIMTISVPSAHSRVLRRLDKHTRGVHDRIYQLGASINHERAQQLVNGHLAQSLVDTRWANTVQRILQGLDEDGATILHEYREAVRKLSQLAIPSRWAGSNALDGYDTRELVDFLIRNFDLDALGQEQLVRRVVEINNRRILSCELRLRQHLPGLAKHLRRPPATYEGPLNDLVRDFTHLLNNEE